MSSRFLQKDFLKCSKCSFMHRYARGYKAIPNPILFNADAHCRSFANEQRASVGYTGLKVSCKCPQCEKFHSEWTWMDFQSFLDAKSKLSLAEQRKYLSRSNPIRRADETTSSAEATTPVASH